MNQMNIEIKRHPSFSGTLHIDGRPICHTEEHPRTALPPGEYRIIRHHCKQYDRLMPVIIPRQPEPVSGSVQARCTRCPKLPDEVINLNTTLPCICPMLKPGNGVHHREDGSIILGTRIIPGCLKHPLQAFNPLAERIRKAIARGTVITLKITEQ